MAELRKNPLTREWVMMASEEPHSSDESEGCPYCPGNEHRCAPELLAYRDPSTDPDTPGWRVRVVSHLASHFQPYGDLRRRDYGIYDTMYTVGADEIIIETPVHDEASLEPDAQRVEEALWACRERCVRWCAREAVKSVIISRRYPARNPDHPHWRLLALPVIPQRLWELARGMEQYYDYRGRCGVCHIGLAERADGRRMVVQNHHFLALAPYTAICPYEMWIVPRRHQGSLAHLQPPEMQSLARIIVDATTALRDALRDAACVMSFMCAPCNIEGMEHFHWFLRMLPGIGAPDGIPLEYGMSANDVAPEVAARRLRRSLLAAPALERKLSPAELRRP